MNLELTDILNYILFVAFVGIYNVINELGRNINRNRTSKFFIKCIILVYMIKIALNVSEEIISKFVLDITILSLLVIQIIFCILLVFNVLRKEFALVVNIDFEDESEFTGIKYTKKIFDIIKDCDPKSAQLVLGLIDDKAIPSKLRMLFTDRLILRVNNNEISNISILCNAIDTNSISDRIDSLIKEAETEKEEIENVK